MWYIPKPKRLNRSRCNSNDTFISFEDFLIEGGFYFEKNKNHYPDVFQKCTEYTFLEDDRLKISVSPLPTKLCITYTNFEHKFIKIFMACDDFWDVEKFSKTIDDILSSIVRKYKNLSEITSTIIPPVETKKSMEVLMFTL